MNREIKLRAWDKRNKKMVDFEYLQHHRSGFRLFDKEDWGNEFELMQFTGLKDKNGKEKSVEIYEGDLMRSLPNGMEPREIFEVYWDDEMSGWMMRDIKSKLHHIPLEESFQVIGNIYENKELLNSKPADE